MIYLSQLDKLVKHYLVRTYYEQGVSSLCIEHFLPLCAALLYPYKNEEIKLDCKSTNESILPIIESVKKITKKSKGLEKYNLIGLKNYFQSKWLTVLDFPTQVRYVKGVSLIINVQTDGFFSLKGNDAVYKFYYDQPILDISSNYGTKSFEISNKNTTVNGNQDDVDLSCNPKVNEENTSIEPLKNFLYTYLPLCQYPNGLKQYDYFWEYKISNEQYELLKETLHKLNLGERTGLLNSSIKGYGTVARIVTFFVSEWYKRECITLDGDKCLDYLGLSSKNSGLVWKYSGLPQHFLHQSDGENQMRQIAMCALGGLPLEYVNKSKRFVEFVNRLFNIYQKEDTSSEDIENIVDCFDDGNGVFKRSLESGSCKKYLIKLIDYLEYRDKTKLPFCESDICFPPFSEFLRKLQEGYDCELPKRFFSLEIKIWTHDYIEDGDDSNIIESNFHIQIGFFKSKNVITAKELSKLGVRLPYNTDIFNIHLEIIDKDNNVKRSEKSRTYFKIGNGCEDFCGAFGSDIETPIDLFEVQEITLWLESGEYRSKIYAYSVPTYFELYSTDDYYQWTTSKNNAARKVVFYNKKIYIPLEIEDSEIQTKSAGKREWGWIYLKSNITLQDNNGNEITIEIGQSEAIVVDFRTNRLSKDFELLGDGCVKSVIDGQDENVVHLLYYSQQRQLMLTCDKIRDSELWEQYEILYKKINDDLRYTQWNDNNPPEQGFLKLRIRCRDASKKKRDWTGIVYFIGDVMPKKWRNLNNNFIYFIGDNVSPIDNTLNIKGKKLQDSSQYKPDEKIIPFRIGDLYNHVIIKAYRAFNWREIWNGNERIKNVLEATAPSPIAIILQKNIKIKVVDKNGYTEYSPQSFEYLNYFDNPNTISNTFMDNSSESFNRYIYLSSFNDGGKNRKIEKNGNSIFLHVSDKHISKYNLYYWSGLTNDTPIKLERKNIESRKYEYTIPSALADKAIVFQSLKGCKPNLYFRPFYAEDMTWDYYVGRYSGVDTTYHLKCYHLAVEHNVYFCVFPALRVLQNRDDFTNFIRAFILEKKGKLSMEDVDGLTRLAKELAMDWFFVNRRKLFDKLDDESIQNVRECMNELLLCSPIERGDKYFSRRFVERFLQDSGNFNQRNGSLPRKFLKALDVFSNYDGYRNNENRINLLNELISTKDNIFEEICCKILNI